jgi:hypothetical protein
MNTRLVKRYLIACLAALVVGCGGGGGAGGGTLAGVGIGGSGITSFGAVTAIGSITVNGVKFDTQGAAVTIDDATGQENDLKVGLVVSVSGTLNNDRVTGKATRVGVDNELNGTVDAAPTITPGGGTFAVFGQTVVVDGNTVFGNATGLADLSAGTALEVSGFPDSSGQVRATRVEKKDAPAASSKSKGIASNVNTSARTFTLGTLSVNYAGAQQINFPAGGLSNGLSVVVRSNSQPSGGVFTASSVEVRAGGFGQASGEGQIEGIMNGLAGSAPNFSFSVDGQNVAVNGGTAYETGSSANLANNARVEVEGQIAGGVLVATKVKFKESNSDVRITAQVSAKSTTSATLTVFGVPGVSVKTDSSTIFQDGSSQRLRIFGFADVQVNDWLEIEAAKDGANSVVATKVVRVDAPSNNRAILQGPADTRTASPDIFILGVDGRTQAATAFQGASGGPISQANFFSLATAGAVVRMRGPFTGQQINPVDEAQLED